MTSLENKTGKGNTELNSYKESGIYELCPTYKRFIFDMPPSRIRKEIAKSIIYMPLFAWFSFVINFYKIPLRKSSYTLNTDWYFRQWIGMEGGYAFIKIIKYKPIRGEGRKIVQHVIISSFIIKSSKMMENKAMNCVTYLLKTFGFMLKTNIYNENILKRNLVWNR